MSRVVQSTIRAIEAAEPLLDACAEIDGSGKTELAGRLWAMHLASLIAAIPRWRRKKYMKIILKLAKEMDGLSSTGRRGNIFEKLEN